MNVGCQIQETKHHKKHHPVGKCKVKIYRKKDPTDASGSSWIWVYTTQGGTTQSPTYYSYYSRIQVSSFKGVTWTVGKLNPEDEDDELEEQGEEEISENELDAEMEADVESAETEADGESGDDGSDSGSDSGGSDGGGSDGGGGGDGGD